MSKIHFLNVLEGDCNIIQHGNSNRVTVIDVSNASNVFETQKEKEVRESAMRNLMLTRTQVPAYKKDYKQKHTPDNPIQYLKGLGVKEIWRFIITHPDMDHLDGVRDLYSEFRIVNTWDTDNNKECDLENFGGGYNSEDWEFYLKIRDGKYNDTTRLTLYAGQSAQYWNDDHIRILGPTPELLATANNCGDWNDSSYALLYTPPKRGGGTWKFLFAGDTHDGSWDHIIKNYKSEVSNVDVLFAPHHGRDSNRNYDFLDTLKPRITLFGNASSKHLAYDKYPETRITNNQAGYIVMDITEDHIDFYVENQEFANDFRNNPKRGWGNSRFNAANNAWQLCRLS